MDFYGELIQERLEASYANDIYPTETKIHRT